MQKVCPNIFAVLFIEIKIEKGHPEFNPDAPKHVKVLKLEY